MGYEKTGDNFTVETENQKFNEFLASFPLGLTADKFETKFHNSTGRLRTRVMLSLGFSFMVELKGAKPEFSAGTFVSANKKVSVLLNDEKRTVVLFSTPQTIPILDPLLMKPFRLLWTTQDRSGWHILWEAFWITFLSNRFLAMRL